MADAEPALAPPPAPAASVPQPAPSATPAPEPAVVAPTPMVEEEVNLHSCYNSSLAFRFRQLGFSCTFFVVPLPMLFALHVFFISSLFLRLAIFGLGILCGFFCSALIASRSLQFFCSVSIYFIAVLQLGWVRRDSLVFYFLLP